MNEGRRGERKKGKKGGGEMEGGKQARGSDESLKPGKDGTANG